MFCKNCGAQIDENSKFCNACGCEIGGGEKKEVHGDGKTLLIAGAQAKWSYFLLILGIIEFFVSIGLFFSAINININAFSSSDEVSKRNQEIIFSLLFIAVGAMCIYEGIKWASMKLTICENVIYVSFGASAASKVKLTYDEILSISGSDSFHSIAIESKAKTYSLVHMEHVGEAVQLVQNRIKQ